MLELKHIYKRYLYQRVLEDVSLSLPDCGMIGIVGPSGCGKSTLLHIIGGIDRDFQGDIYFDQKRVTKHLTRYRKKYISFIFQQFHLIMWLSIKQNIELSRYFHPQSFSQNDLDIKDFEQLDITSLSLGQRQRIAFLRARFQNSQVLLCDEPTGSLDQDNAKEVMALLKEESQRQLVIIVSHDMKLMKLYCDELYEMQDGCICQHSIMKKTVPLHITPAPRKKMLFPCLRLSLMSLLSHQSRTIQLVLGLTLSLVCIVLTLTMSQGLEKQMTQYIYSLVPSSGISFQSLRHVSLTEEFGLELQQLPSISKVQLYLDDYECLGVGFQSERYQESETLFIGDDTSPYQGLSVKIGRYPQADHEVMVSLSTAMHLCQENPIEDLIGKSLYAWYKHDNSVKAIQYHVVGITQQVTTLDTLYQQTNAYIHLLKDVYHFDETKVNAGLGIIYVDKGSAREDVVKYLQQHYPDYKYLEIGASTTQNIQQTMQQVRIVLYIFSGLAIISSLFLVGEVMFLNAVQKKKDLAIMKCFGASSFDLLKIVLYESLEVLFLSQLLCTFIYHQLISIANAFVKEMLVSYDFVFAFDIRLLFYVYAMSLCLIFVSQMAPLIYVFRLNTIAALKD